MRNAILWGIALALVTVAVSCTSKPAPPKPGTPAFFWAAANEAYRNGDYRKTNDNLRELSATENEFTARARPMAIVVSISLAEGFSELADTYEAGARMNRANPLPFHRQVSVFRSLASDAAIQGTEALHAFLEHNTEPGVAFAFAFPGDSVTLPAASKRIASGILIPDAERDAIERATMEAKVPLNLCRATGNNDDAAKTLELFKAGEVRIPREVFLLSVAGSLHALTDLFTPAKLDQPNRTRILCTEASEALASIPANKETRQLAAKIAATLKKLKST